MNSESPPRAYLDASEQQRVLRNYEAHMQLPVLLLSLAWLVLLVLEFVRPDGPLFNVFGTVIWCVLILDFVIRLALTPGKLTYLKANWLGALSLALPALRLLQFTRAVYVARTAQAASSFRLIALVTSFNHGVQTLGGTLRRRGFAYVVALSVLITFVGAAGMYVFEQTNTGFRSYGDAVWFTAMIMLTLGSNTWPVTAEGRLLCVLLALYAFTVLGYLTATLASMFIGTDASGQAGGAEQDVADIKAELESVRLELHTLTERLTKPE